MTDRAPAGPRAPRAVRTLPQKRVTRLTGANGSARHLSLVSSRHPLVEVQ